MKVYEMKEMKVDEMKRVYGKEKKVYEMKEKRDDVVKVN
jgi:hypothetical protein